MGGAEFSESAWTRNPYLLKAGAVSWAKAEAIEKPEPGKEYTIWHCEARKNRLRDGTQGPAVFDFEIRIKYEPMGSDDNEGTQTFTYDDAGENKKLTIGRPRLFLLALNLLPDADHLIA